MPTTNSSYVIFILLFSLFIGPGCETFQSTKAKEKKAEIELKKKNFDALYASVSTNNLKTGMTTTEIQSTYGKPDDTYSSGSSDSRFEMWTYERVLQGDQEDWQPIRLYFNNGKLASWKY